MTSRTRANTSGIAGAASAAAFRWLSGFSQNLRSAGAVVLDMNAKAIALQWDNGPARKDLPVTRKAVVLRTDFSRDAEWGALVADVGDWAEDRWPGSDVFEYLSDPAYDGLTGQELGTLMSRNAGRACVFVVDEETFAHPDRPILVVDASGGTFRVTPADLPSVLLLSRVAASRAS
jgi:hypothetical protein